MVEEQVSAEDAQGAPEQRSEIPRQQGHRGMNRAAENVVFVGKKPTMNYVLAVVTQFSDGLKEVHIKARGKSISRAVDVAEVVRKRFIPGTVTGVMIDTEEIIDDQKNKINVSTIDIVLNK